jgi:chemotaxis signal transduction protein
MGSELLKDFFVPSEQILEEDCPEQSSIWLHFKYGKKRYCAGISEVKEIIDLPLIMPFPVAVGNYLGVFNLRGNIIPIMDPDRFFIQIQSELRFKSQDYFNKLKLRLIVFENNTGHLVALPAMEVGKAEMTLQEEQLTADFILIKNVPYEKFEIANLFEGAL